MSRAFPTLFPTGSADYSAPRVRPVTIGYYVKHLMLYQDGRFAKHPRFHYFALNTEMRWRALQAGRIYVKQHLEDAHLSVAELREMVGSRGEAFSNRVMHFGASLRGTSSYWFKQRCRLIAMVDTIGLPTVFFTHSAADLQWPELANLICADDASDSNNRRRALTENPAIADWFFHERIHQFIKYFYVEVLGVKDYWLRYEWQHRGSPHVHGLAWLPNAPDISETFIGATTTEESRQHAISSINSVVSTINPALPPLGTNTTAPPAQTNPHVCNKPYAAVVDHHQDLVELIATCQRHTRCSPSYCLRTKNGKQQCRFDYPKPLQEETTVTVMENGDIELLTVRNDSLINSFNPIQLSGWRANVDMQYCVSRQKVINYCAKYATKCEPRSQPLKEVYKSIVRGLNEEDKSLKAVQKLLISSVGERDYSAQETCHLLLQIPMYHASRDFVYLSLDGSRAVDEHLDEDQAATAPSAVDHYVARPTTPDFLDMTLLHFVQHYAIRRNEPSRRTKAVVVIVRPHYSPDPDGERYEQYCQQKLMLHKPFREQQQLLAGFPNYTLAYAHFLCSGNIPPSLEDDIHRLEQQSQDHRNNDDEHDQHDERNHCHTTNRAVEEWMLLCQHHPELSQQDPGTQGEIDWCAAAQAYPNLEECPTFITRHKQSTQPQQFNTTADPIQLQGKQLQAYNIVRDHLQQNCAEPLHMIVLGTAGTGKSYLIHCLKQLLQDRVRVMAPTGVAAFNVEGRTLHSLLNLPTRGEIKELEGDRLRHLQENLTGVDYIIIDEMSMVGRKLFGQVDKRLRQAFPHHADQVLGRCSCLLFGDFGQLPLVMDLPLYASDSRSSLSDLGRSAYQVFDRAVVLDQVMRQIGQDPAQIRFREILLRLRDGHLAAADWQHLMTRTATQVADSHLFSSALHLHPTVEAVVDHNLTKLQGNGHPIARIAAVHTGPGAHKATTDDAAGLEPVVCLAHGARVMLTANLWIDAGLVNGAMGTVQAICYTTGGPPALPTAIMVHFDNYSGPTLPDSCVPIVPIRRTWLSTGVSCSRLQLPLKLAWAVTIHKAQGLTLDKTVINIGKKEFCAGLTFVACSRVRHLTDLVFLPPFDFQRVSNLGNSQRLVERRLEDTRLRLLEETTLPRSPTCSPSPPPMDTPSPPSFRSISPPFTPFLPSSPSPTPSPPPIDHSPVC